MWIVNADGAQIISKLSISLVGEDIEVLLISNDVLNIGDTFSIIDVDFGSTLNVNVQDIFRGGKYKLCLL